MDLLDVINLTKKTYDEVLVKKYVFCKPISSQIKDDSTKYVFTYLTKNFIVLELTIKKINDGLIHIFTKMYSKSCIYTNIAFPLQRIIFDFLDKDEQNISSYLYDYANEAYKTIHTKSPELLVNRAKLLCDYYSHVNTNPAFSIIKFGDFGCMLGIDADYAMLINSPRGVLKLCFCVESKHYMCKIYNESVSKIKAVSSFYLQEPHKDQYRDVELDYEKLMQKLNAHVATFLNKQQLDKQTVTY